MDLTNSLKKNIYIPILWLGNIGRSYMNERYQKDHRRCVIQWSPKSLRPWDDPGRPRHTTRRADYSLETKWRPFKIIQQLKGAALGHPDDKISRSLDCIPDPGHLLPHHPRRTGPTELGSAFNLMHKNTRRDAQSWKLRVGCTKPNRVGSTHKRSMPTFL